MIRMYHKILFLCLVLALNNTSGQKRKPAQSRKNVGPQQKRADRHYGNGYYDDYSYEDPYFDKYVGAPM